MKLKVRDKAPDFTLSSQIGASITLSDFACKKNVVLYFYPMNRSPVCTKEAQGFRDNYKLFKGLDAEVIGVSSNSVESHKAFAEDQKIPFLLLSDTDNKVRKLYGATSSFGSLPGRVTFVIDKKGVIRHIFSSLLQPKKHIEEALETMKKIVKQTNGEEKH